MISCMGEARGIVRLRTLGRTARSLAARYGRGLRSSLRPNRPGVFAEVMSAPEFARDVAAHDLAAMWIGHATVLLRIGGVTILTDPVLSQRIGPCVGGRTLGIERLMPLPFHPSLMPALDIVLISHAHFDHLDRPSLQRLVNPRTTVITARGTRRLIPPGFANIIEMDWADRVSLGGVQFSAIRPRHWGARSLWDHHRGCNSYLIEGEGRRILFGGDTAMTAAFDNVGGADIAVFGIGAYEPWERAHATPEQVWTMVQAAGARHILPVHHSTFPMGDEARDEPMWRLLTAAGTDAGRVLKHAPGDLWAA